MRSVAPTKWRSRRVRGFATILIETGRHRAPDAVIGANGQAHFCRWFLVPYNRFFNVRLHEFLRSDPDEVLHDHPWWNFSIVLTAPTFEPSDERAQSCCAARGPFIVSRRMMVLVGRSSSPDRP